MVAGFLIFGAVMLSVHIASSRSLGAKLPPHLEVLPVSAPEENEENLVTVTETFH
jgi:hypothetical protein